MNLNKFLLIVIVLLASCKPKEPEHKTILIYDGDSNEQVEELNGMAKEVSISTTSGSGTLLFLCHIYFDKKGSVLQSNNKFLTGFTPVYDTIIYSSLYNKAGKKISMTGIHSEWTYPSKHASAWTFDTSGRAIQYRFLWDTIRKAGPITDFQYDSIGRLRLKKVLRRKIEPDLYKYKYDANNHLVELKWYVINRDKNEEELQTVINFEYKEFDSHNNWIKKIENEPRAVQTDGSLKAGTGLGYTTTRKITYY